jgi:hypothetical protein
LTWLLLPAGFFPVFTAKKITDSPQPEPVAGRWYWHEPLFYGGENCRDANTDGWLILKTAFDTEITEKITENTEG